jgi:hypothetical protein
MKEGAMNDLQEWVVATIDAEGGQLDVVAEAAAMLAENGVETERHGHDLHVTPHGLVLSPRGLGISDGANGGVRTMSIVRARHLLAIPEGLFEYQHAIGADPRESLRSGFSQWAQIDLPVLLDALRETPEVCAVMQMTFPGVDGGPERERRVLLGPTARMAQHAAAGDEDNEHPFCPCCLTTNSFDALKPLFEATETLGVRLFAMRGEDGETSADCRVNGEEFEAGSGALRAYAESWPDCGFEFRKQYVLFQSALRRS